MKTLKKENQNILEGIIVNMYTGFGKGYGVKVCGTKNHEYYDGYPLRQYYYGYSKKEAVALYRKEYGLQRKHIMFTDYTNDHARDIHYI